MSLAYWTFRVAESVRHHVRLPLKSSADVLRAIAADLRQPLTSVSVVKGDSMAPTLNDHVADDENGDKVVVRRLMKPVGYSVHQGDVVVIVDPDPTVKAKKAVRRVVAMPGDEMLSTDPEEKGFTLDPDTCWVTCDNEQTTKRDSRVFGPLHMDNIIGRVIYRFRSKTEHGPIKNSDLSEPTDQLVIHAEEEIFKAKV